MVKLRMTGRRSILRGLGSVMSLLCGHAARAAGGRRFHVSPEGDDAADGLSEARPLRSLAAVNALRLRPGDEVLLQRGGTWRGCLVPPASGTPQQPIRFGAYGHGTRPVLTGALPVKGLVAVRGRAAFWRAPLEREPTQLFIDGVRGLRMATPPEVTKPSQWHWGDGELTLAGRPGAPPPEAEASLVDFGLDACGRAHLVFEDLQFLRAAWHGVLADTLSQAAFYRCRISDAFVNGIQASAAERHDGIVIEENEIVGCGGSGLNIGGRLSSWSIRRNTIHHCCLLHEGMPGPRRRSGQLEWSAGIKAWGWGYPGYQGACVVEDNLIADLGAPRPDSRGTEANKRGIGIWWDEVVAPVQRQGLRWNTVQRCQSRGIYVEKSDAVDVDYNLILDCAAVDYAGSLALQANSAGYDAERDTPGRFPRSAKGNRFRHNTVVCSGWALEIVAEEAGCRMDNNEISDNILIGDLHVVGGGVNDGQHGMGNTFRRNCLGPEGPRWRWGRRVYRSHAALEVGSAGSWAVGIVGDPGFVDPAGGDYRLLPDSPCIDISSGLVQSRDRLGIAVPQGRAADLGCHEYRRG